MRPIDHIDRILNAAPILSLVGETAELAGANLTKEAYVGMQMALQFVNSELKKSCDALIPLLSPLNRQDEQQPVLLKRGAA